MNRRRLLGGLVGLGASAAITVGSGAFSSVEAERSLDVRVTGDNDARLALSQLGAGMRSFEGSSPEQVQFSFPGLNQRLADSHLGLGKDSVYEFVRDTGESSRVNPTEGLLRIENRGTQPVDVYSKQTTSAPLEFELFDVADATRTALRTQPAELNVGEFVDVGVRIRTFDATVGSFNETLRVAAEATQS